MKTIYLMFAGVFALNGLLFGQQTSFQIGLNSVPLVDKTVELQATLAGNPGYEFFIHGGYSFPKFYEKNQDEDYSRYWEGTANGAYLKLGARAYLNETGKFRIYLGPQLTAGYLNQAGKSTTVLCPILHCISFEGEGKRSEYALSAGITGGVRTNILPRLTLDIGVQANRFIFEKPDLANQDMYIPGYGRRPLQGVASIQYTLKGR